MIKKVLFLMFAALPFSAMAQSEWEVPDFEKKPEKEVVKEKTEKEKKKKSSIEPQYGVGAVPTVNGRVEWTVKIPAPGHSGQQLFDKALAAMNNATKAPGQSKQSRITAVNRKEFIIAAHFDEEMVFSNSTFAKDFADFRYTLIVKCKDGEEEISLCRLSYRYNIGRPEEEVTPAEELITDEECMNKTKTKFYKTHGKFRKKTIDRKEEIINHFRLAIMD